MRGKNQVVQEVKAITGWWLTQRKKKLEEQLNETMSINPFLMPFLFDYHNLKSLDELADLIVSSHLMTGHATGFGKLVDEKILPQVFGTQKLDKKYRQGNSPLNLACFDEIDHYILRENGTRQFLSLKAGKWTIQLTMAVQLNIAFSEIKHSYSNLVDEVVVGVFYGKADDLTDKYDILRGINRGADHAVKDITDFVSVYSGRDFWAWLNDGQQETQEWVLEGIIEALKEGKIHETAVRLLKEFREGVVSKYEDHVLEGETLNWYLLLKKING
jgi:Type II restriction endonuclease EcoO109I